MKRFIVITALFSVSILAGWVIFQASAASPVKPESDLMPDQVYYVTDEMLETIQSGNQAVVPVTGAEARKIAPVFDSTGAVVSDPTGTILGGTYSADVKIAPVFDTTGAVVSDPTGTLWNASNP